MQTTRVLVCLVMAAVLATSVCSVAQTVVDVFQVSYFSNAASTKNGDQIIRIVNPGFQGNPFSNKGDICANIYVFDSNRTMQACCSCKVDPNATLTFSLKKNLLRRPVNPTTPSSGVIKLVSGTSPLNVNSCNPTSVAPAANLRATMEHLDVIAPSVKVPIDSPSATPFLSVAAFEPSDLSMSELENLIAGCMNISATNACSCGT